MKNLANLLAATAISGMATAASAGETMKFGHVGAPGSMFEASVNNFAECTNAALAGEVEVQTFG